MDLTKQAPRSPYAELGGIAWLPRAIDKGRAKLAGTNGEYNFDCPMDQILFNDLGIDGPAFLEALETARTDDAALDWVRKNARNLSPEAIKKAGEHILSHGPNPQKREYFDNAVAKYAPGRTDITTWAEIIAIEEGYPVPARTK